MEAKWIDSKNFLDYQDDIVRLGKDVYSEQRPNYVLPFGQEAMEKLLDENGQICTLYQQEQLIAYFYVSQVREIIESIIEGLPTKPSGKTSYLQYVLIGGLLLKKNLRNLRHKMPEVVKEPVLKLLREDERFASVDKILIKVTNEAKKRDQKLILVENPFMKRFIKSLNELPGTRFKELGKIQRQEDLPIETVYLANIKNN